MKKYLLFFFVCVLGIPVLTLSQEPVVTRRRVVRRERNRGRSTGEGLLFGALSGGTFGGLAGGRKGAGIGAGVGALTGGIIGATRPKYKEEVIEEYPVSQGDTYYKSGSTKRSYLAPRSQRYKTPEYYEPDYKASRYTRPYRGQRYHPLEDK